MSRWTGTWLGGTDAPLEPADGPQRWRGERLGLPETGRGSAAGTFTRFLALLVDLVLSSLATSLFFRPVFDDPEVMQRFNYWALLVWFAITVIGVSIGITPGMALLGVRVVRMDNTPLVGPLRAIPRTLLVAVVIPAVIWDKDGRGLHDRLAGTIVLRTR